MKYCYWSIGIGANREKLHNCVITARNSGVFQDFHVFSDKPIEFCETYDAMLSAVEPGIERLQYLKAGISKLPYDYYIWIDPKSVFYKKPDNPIASLGYSPVHVPLEIPVDTIPYDTLLDGISASEYKYIFNEHGIYNKVYYSRTALWIVRRSAIDILINIAKDLIVYMKKCEYVVNDSIAISYAAQMLCANPNRHLMSNNGDFWSIVNSDTDYTSLMKRPAIALCGKRVDNDDQ